MKTFSAKPQDVKHDWFVVDASDKVLGRLAAEIALRLRGKHKPEYTPHVDTGDFIVVVNAGQICASPATRGWTRSTTATADTRAASARPTSSNMQSRFPGRALEKAVKGMLPKGPLGYAMIKKLKVYAERQPSARRPAAADARDLIAASGDRTQTEYTKESNR